MKKLIKLFIIPILMVVMSFSFALNAKAVINSEYDIQYKLEKLTTLKNFDFFSIINKNELIGYRLENFNMSSTYYVNNVISVMDSLRNILNQIDIVKNSADYSDTEKSMQLNKLYQDANTALNDLDIKTMNFIIEARNYMPSMTYQKYAKKFREYYNSLEISGSIVEVK